MRFNTGSGAKRRRFFCWQEGDEFMASALEETAGPSFRPIARFNSRAELEAEIARRNGEIVWQEV